MNKLTQNIALWLISPGLFFSFLSIANAQSWQSALQLGNSNIQSIQALASVEDGVIIGASFTEDLSIGDTELQSKGEEDIFLAILDESQSLRVILQGSSTLEDKIEALEVDQMGNILMAGSFWLRIDFGTFSLETSAESPKGLFLIKLTPAGELIWSQVFEGGSIKGINDIDVSEHIHIGGYFSEEISFADTLHQAEGRSSAFVASFASDGNLLWSRSFGNTGNTRVTTAKQITPGQLIISGFYDDTLAIDEQRFPANTNDEDVFIASFNPQGSLNWVRKAGGVFNEQSTAMLGDSLGNIYISGQIVGVMKLDEQLSIQSRDGNADCFLIKYDSSGQVLWGKVFGGDQLQFSNDLLLREDQVWICGAFQENINFDQLRLDAGFGFEGYLAQVDLDGNIQRLEPISSDNGAVLPSLLAEHPNGVWVGGDFSGNFAAGGIQLQTNPNVFNVFLLEWNEFITQVENALDGFEVDFFPNPTFNHIQSKSKLQTYTIEVFDTYGRIVFKSANPVERIDMSKWRAGTYLFRLSYNNQVLVKPIVKL